MPYWGGALRNPAAVLAGALATLVDSRGRILVDGLRPPVLPEPVAAALADLMHTCWGRWPAKG
ncbi:hypothetical protein [Streptomyces coeruleorubidus]|uniref:hypothetical protein n=1 Tax=Streptomyces coeruleorubidus TaxID=116188 RepID=UPI0033CD05C9